MLTVEPGPDIAPFHDRQIVVLRPEDGMDCLSRAKPEAGILKAQPKGRLTHTPRRKNGIELE